MLRINTVLVSLLVLSVLIFIGCQNEPTPVEQDSNLNQTGLSKFTLPAGAEFVSATFNVLGHEANGEPIFVHRITSDWQEMVVTWNSFYSDPSPYVPTPEGNFNASVGWNSLDVTNLVGSWLDGTNSNYGLLLDQQNWVSGKNRFNTKAYNPSYLEITYLDGSGNTQIETTPAIEDTYIYDESHAGENYGDAYFMITGWSAEKQALVKFELETIPTGSDCETAYAYGEQFATCFLDMPGVTSNNWGWSNGPIPDDPNVSYSWDIYAGAGQCDISKGTVVGTLDVVYSGGTATITYNINPGFTLEETHLFVGDEILPRKKNGKFTTAPGQFPYSGQSSYTITGLSGDIYVAAHSVVCGNFE